MVAIIIKSPASSTNSTFANWIRSNFQSSRWQPRGDNDETLSRPHLSRLAAGLHQENGEADVTRTLVWIAQLHGGWLLEVTPPGRRSRGGMALGYTVSEGYGGEHMQCGPNFYFIGPRGGKWCWLTGPPGAGSPPASENP